MSGTARGAGSVPSCFVENPSLSTPAPCLASEPASAFFFWRKHALSSPRLRLNESHPIIARQNSRVLAF
ncbi:MAG TPA: hypothetical protein VMV49_18000 [Candidatus Deferrimicrobium sp.]|nr:hypothetical protein [Candidatus Deferrimicrobium sp.]